MNLMLKLLEKQLNLQNHAMYIHWTCAIMLLRTPTIAVSYSTSEYFRVSTAQNTESKVQIQMQ